MELVVLSEHCIVSERLLTCNLAAAGRQTSKGFLKCMIMASPSSGRISSSKGPACNKRAFRSDNPLLLSVCCPPFRIQGPPPAWAHRLQLPGSCTRHRTKSEPAAPSQASGSRGPAPPKALLHQQGPALTRRCDCQDSCGSDPASASSLDSGTDLPLKLHLNSNSRHRLRHTLDTRLGAQLSRLKGSALHPSLA